MTAVLAPHTADDVPLAVCRVQDSVTVHLVRELPGSEGQCAAALCGATVVPGRPEQLLLRSPCLECLAEAQEQGIRTVRDGTSVWVNIERLAQAVRSGVRVAA